MAPYISISDRRQEQELDQRPSSVSWFELMILLFGGEFVQVGFKVILFELWYNTTSHIAHMDAFEGNWHCSDSVL